MSIKIMSDVWANGPEQQGELLVLLVLSDYANDDGECWPAVESIAQKARITARSVRRILRNLEENGYIQTSANRGRNHTNLYLICLEALKTGQYVPPDISDQNRTLTTKNRTSATVKPDSVSPKPSRTIKEPPIRADDLFDQFWKEHPKSVNESTSKATFLAAVKSGVDPEWIVSSAKKYATSKRGTEVRYVKHSDGWLDDERWKEFPRANKTAGADKLDFYAAKINGDGFLPTSMISTSLAAELIASGKVSPERMRERISA